MTSLHCSEETEIKTSLTDSVTRSPIELKKVINISHFEALFENWQLLQTYESDRNQDAGKESVRANCPAHQQALCAIELHCVSRAFSCRVSPSLSTTTACRSVRWTCDIAKVASSASCQIISSNSKRKGEKEAESSSTDPKANHISDFQWFFIKQYLNKNLMASEIRLL